MNNKELTPNKENVEIKKRKIEKMQMIYVLFQFNISVQMGWGYLPIPVQNLLQFDNKCSVKIETRKLKKYVCVLRKGVENNDKQSFIACVNRYIFKYEYNEWKNIIYKRNERIYN